eukprot:9539922-Alexandrium_andersonii.AAC.1
MSASLVGSEMCIRDSKVSRSPDGPADCTRDCGEAGGLGGAEIWGKGGHCLLYTSDAADDM